MPRLTLDLTEAQVFEPIPEGLYDATISDVSEPQRGPKSAYVRVEFTISDGPHEGRKIWRNYPIEGRGAGFFIDLANKAVGAELSPGDMVDFDTDDLVGAEVRILVSQTEFPEGSGEFRNEVARLV